MTALDVVVIYLNITNLKFISNKFLEVINFLFLDKLMTFRYYLRPTIRHKEDE